MDWPQILASIFVAVVFIGMVLCAFFPNSDEEWLEEVTKREKRRLAEIHEQFEREPK